MGAHRTSYGDQFYDDIPERSADSLLPEIPILQEKLAAIALHLLEKPIESSMADKRDLAVSLGCQEARNGAGIVFLTEGWGSYLL